MFADDVERIYLTAVDASVEGDTYFTWDRAKWRVIESEQHAADERHPHAFAFQTLERA